MNSKNAVRVTLVALVMALMAGCASLQPVAETHHYSSSNSDRSAQAKAGIVMSFF